MPISFSPAASQGDIQTEVLPYVINPMFRRERPIDPLLVAHGLKQTTAA
jgi:hypothetical protein